MNRTYAVCASALLALGACAGTGASDQPAVVILKPYLWAPAVQGDTAIGDTAADIDASFSDLLSNLDLAGMIELEVRKGRCGVIVDGIYMKLSDDASTPGPFFSLIETTLELTALDLGLAYRAIDRERYWVDALVGARYINLTIEMDLEPDFTAIDEISSTVMDRTVKAIRGEVEKAVDGSAGAIADDLADVKEGVGDEARERVEDLKIRIKDKVSGIVEGIGGGIGDGIDLGPPQDALRDAIRDAIAEQVQDRIDDHIDEIQGNADDLKEQIREAAEEAVDDLKRKASKEVRKALDKAEQQLEEKIRAGMEKAAATKIEKSRDWVDPYVGLRARCEVTEKIYLGARGDIGPFGVGSDLTWQAFAGMGMQITETVAVEAGYRRLDVDYDHDGLALDVAFSGATLGVGIEL